jgi:predicted transcriptional regulator
VRCGLRRLRCGLRRHPGAVANRRMLTRRRPTRYVFLMQNRRKPQPRRPPGDLESAILGALWAAGEALTPAQTLAALGDDLAYTTVMTTLSRLHEKGTVTRRRSGRAFVYAPATDVADNTAAQMRKLLDRADHAAVLTRFVGTLDETDETLLGSLLAAAKRRARRP